MGILLKRMRKMLRFFSWQGNKYITRSGKEMTAMTTLGETVGYFKYAVCNRSEILLKTTKGHKKNINKNAVFQIILSQ